MVKQKQAQVVANQQERAERIEQELVTAAGGQAEEWVRFVFVAFSCLRGRRGVWCGFLLFAAQRRFR